ncbi:MULTISPECIES: nucleotidyltransferase family protein [Microbacterium]|uniref:nucleotidyltransferase family protein n=1 Tax=Microbacterium TaxID=33882 RepID=UPI00217DA2BB|nr:MULTISPECIES: nucleotidyltransferase domain-containing protein [Microbacterium]UWF77871.1 nucleotidyltransferase domain-containing protein [Microbacterium neungamense]WCM56047.1 nucleotidyltransferase domain-containing protein [Microbacterium sp. EF45047]
MGLQVDLDREVIARIARSHAVQRLHVFGSATTSRFREESDVDVLVEFHAGVQDPFDAYFGLKEDLEKVLGRPVDLVMASAVRNPYFRARAAGEAQEIYAA